MVKELLAKLAARQSLTFTEAAYVVAEIADGRVSDAQIAAFLTGLRAKGETVAEIAGCVSALRQRAVCVPHSQQQIFDCCGTGGDGLHSFNISTAASLVVAACGVPTAKHGNRAVSSSCGSADLLEAAGARLEVSPAGSAKILDEIGYCFLFAPLYHPAAKRVAAVRRELGFRTVFNLLGPLLNPARATHQVVGAATRSAAETLALVSEFIPDLRITTIFNSHGVDELLPSGVNHRYQWLESGLLEDPIELPLWLQNGFVPEALRGGDKAANLAILDRVLAGEDSAYGTVIDLNAGFALLVAGKTEDLCTGIEMSRAARHSGAARRVLDDFVRLSQETE